MSNPIQNKLRTNRQDGAHADKGVRLTIDELLALRRESMALDLASSYRVSSTLAGGYRSKFRGRGMDFDEVRPYQPGDDIRNIDWRVTARTGKPHTKLFREERERPVFLLLDQSKHLFFGSRVAFKSVIAARAASLLIWASITAGSRIGGVLFDDSGHLEHRPSGRRRDALALLKKISHRHNRVLDNIESKETPVESTKDEQSAFAQSLARLRRLAKPGSLIYIFSDFRTLDADSKRHISRLSHHNEIQAYLLTDPMDEQLPPPGNYSLTDGSSISKINTSEKNMRSQYHDAEVQRIKQLSDYLKQQRTLLQPLSTTANLGVVLAAANTPRIIVK
ncbi:MAG: DUF58 domain-containing protein [Gammaproteobacteria bacterium]|nr:DUF58 domain-containing protein [Gammaproteobacteria bacterium]